MKILESSPRHPKQRGAARLGLGHNGDARATAETTLKVDITEETWQILYSFRRYSVEGELEAEVLAGRVLKIPTG